MDLVSGTAWSPDGALIAVTNDNILRFVDATGAGRRMPNDVPYQSLLGWRGPTSLLSLSGDAGIVEVNIDTGQQRMLSRFSVAQDCEYGLQRCTTYRVQLATALLGSATTRRSDPDRGPWPRGFRSSRSG